MPFESAVVEVASSKDAQEVCCITKEEASIRGASAPTHQSQLLDSEKCEPLFSHMVALSNPIHFAGPCLSPLSKPADSALLLLPVGVKGTCRVTSNAESLPPHTSTENSAKILGLSPQQVCKPPPSNCPEAPPPRGSSSSGERLCKGSRPSAKNTRDGVGIAEAELKRKQQQASHNRFPQLSDPHLDGGELTRWRSHEPNLIHSHELDFVKNIGQGGFCVVEHCIFRPGKDSQPPSNPSNPRSPPTKQATVHVAVKQTKPEGCSMNIVAFMGVGFWNDRLASQKEVVLDYDFLVEEFMGGGTLGDLLGKSGAKPSYSLDDGLRWMTYVASGLSYMHCKTSRVIHRDLKLGNVFLEGGDKRMASAKIGDLGLAVEVGQCLDTSWSYVSEPSTSSRPSAHLKDDPAKDSCPLPVGLQKLEGKVGSLTYMAPEVFMCLDYNEKVDVYSFGIMLYEMVHRQTVFKQLPCRSLKGVEAAGLPSAKEPQVAWPSSLSNAGQKHLSYAQGV
eukprot:gene32470-17871_t